MAPVRLEKHGFCVSLHIENMQKKHIFIAEKTKLPIEYLHKTLTPTGSVRVNSLSRLLAETPDLHAIRYSMLPYKDQGQLTNIPLYAVK